MLFCKICFCFRKKIVFFSCAIFPTLFFIRKQLINCELLAISKITKKSEKFGKFEKFIFSENSGLQKLQVAFDLLSSVVIIIISELSFAFFRFHECFLQIKPIATLRNLQIAQITLLNDAECRSAHS